MEAVKTINFIISIVFIVCYTYQFVYILVPFVVKDKRKGEAVSHRYAVLVSARNEEAVIGNLIESIRRQTYDGGLVTTFVVADNCTDDTARVAADAGAIVFERFDTANVGKGYALNYLLHRIDELFPERPFDGYFVFDADNVLEENYIEEMNEVFSQGYGIVTSYRNSKNFGDNWISSGYALWFLRESQFLNHARFNLGTSCAVSGTGFLFSQKVLDDCGGWHFHLLTEDIEFTVHNVVRGLKIGYCHDAILYDEQPTGFRQSWRQRLRWARGYLQVFGKYGKGPPARHSARQLLLLRHDHEHHARRHPLLHRRVRKRHRRGVRPRRRAGHQRDRRVAALHAAQHLPHAAHHRRLRHHKRVEAHLCAQLEEGRVHLHLPALHAHLYPHFLCRAVCPPRDLEADRPHPVGLPGGHTRCGRDADRPHRLSAALFPPSPRPTMGGAFFARGPQKSRPV